MAWRQHGRARVDPQRPQAFAVCDRCSLWYNHVDLRWQLEWQGPRLANKRLLVCPRCYDKPQEQNRPKPVPPDPVAILNPRPEPFAKDDGPAPNSGSVQSIINSGGQRGSTDDFSPVIFVP